MIRPDQTDQTRPNRDKGRGRGGEGGHTLNDAVRRIMRRRRRSTAAVGRAVAVAVQPFACFVVLLFRVSAQTSKEVIPTLGEL